MTEPENRWAAALSRIPQVVPASSPSLIARAFKDAAPDLKDEATAIALIRDCLAEAPELVDAWQQYSYDKRWSPSPYLDGKEVGFYDDGYQDVDHYDDRFEACAAFVYREAAWILRNRR